MAPPDAETPEVGEPFPRPRDARYYWRLLWPLVAFTVTLWFYWFVWLHGSLKSHGLAPKTLSRLRAAIAGGFLLYLAYWVLLVAWFINSPAGTFAAWWGDATGATIYGDQAFYAMVVVANITFWTTHAFVLVGVARHLRPAGSQRAPADWTTITMCVLLATENLPVVGYRLALAGSLLGLWWYLRVQAIFLGRRRMTRPSAAATSNMVPS